MTYVLGVDLGTSSLKCVLFDENGNVIDSESNSYELIILEQGYSEQNPNDWVLSFKRNIQALIKRQPDLVNSLKALSISGQMHSLVMLDEYGDVIRPAILWNDTRTSEECDEINDFDDIILKTGNRGLEGFTLPKLMWVNKNEPENWEKLSKFLLPKDYLTYYLTGNKVIDQSDASGTMLMDPLREIWNQEILNRFEIDEDVCPKIVQSFDFVGNVQKNVLQEIGLTSDVKVFAGGADNACSALGSGVVFDDQAMLSVGTSGVVLKPKNEYHNDGTGKLHLFSHANPNTYYLMGVTLSAGKSIEWIKENLYPDNSFDEMISMTKNASDTPLLYSPYLMGERTPYPDSKIRGSFIGLDISHKKEDFSKAVLEGVIFSLRDSVEIIERDGDIIGEIISVGGGAKNEIYLQMQANILNKPIRTVLSEEGPATGAAMIAHMGLMLSETLEEAIGKFVKYGDSIYPIPERFEHYNKLYTEYKKIYSATEDICRGLKEKF